MQNMLVIVNYLLEQFIMTDGWCGLHYTQKAAVT